jgi:hypothetical protein
VNSIDPYSDVSARTADARRRFARHSGACVVIRAFDALTLPLLRRLDAEDAHRLAIRGLRLLPPLRPAKTVRALRCARSD